MKTDTRNRKYLITINNPHDHKIDKAYIDKSLSKYTTKYYCGCEEIGGETGTHHIHLYLYFENAIKFSSIKKIFPPANIQPALGNSYQCRDYILKEGAEHQKKDDGSYEYKDSTGKVHKGINLSDTFFESGKCPDEHPGKRSDLELLYELVKEGLTNAEIIEQLGEPAILHIDKINKLRHTYLIDKYKGTRRNNIKVNYITGKTGTGKSRGILDEYGDENVFRVTESQHPFDSYQNEPVIVFEEFRSSLKLSDMLNYLDIYPCTLPARYSPKVACYTTVFVVSNWTFEQQYSEIQKEPEQKASYEAWIRRFNGYVRDYYDVGKFVEYPTMQDYLNRNNHFRPISDEDLKGLPFE